MVVDPAAGHVTGGGWFTSPPGAMPAHNGATGKAKFAFVSKYKKGQSQPTGNTKFIFKTGNLDFGSSSYDWLVITGSGCAKYKGSGTINKAGDYGFQLWACDVDKKGKGFDTFRIKIWDSQETIMYDNKIGGGEDDYGATTIEGGNIRVHQK